MSSRDTAEDPENPAQIEEDPDRPENPALLFLQGSAFAGLMVTLQWGVFHEEIEKETFIAVVLVFAWFIGVAYAAHGFSYLYTPPSPAGQAGLWERLLGSKWLLPVGVIMLVSPGITFGFFITLPKEVEDSAWLGAAGQVWLSLAICFLFRGAGTLNRLDREKEEEQARLEQADRERDWMNSGASSTAQNVDE